MCGIFGYVGKRRNAAQVILRGLKQLEYRGYDSWGITVAANGKLLVDKHAGKIGNAHTNLPRSSFGIGHTRWATHGGVTDVNAHPHLDCTGTIAVVHNGIVENYQEIEKLLRRRHRIVSETDTELVAHLIEDYRKRYPLTEAVRLAFLKLRGLSAFLVADIKDGSMVAVKAGSPLVVGFGKNENVVGSDAYCLSSITREVTFLDNNQLAEVNGTAVRFLNAKTGKEIKPKKQKMDLKTTKATKRQYPHFMIKEIHEQPRALTHILLNFEDRVDSFTKTLKKYPKVYIVGCGSAHYAAMACAYLLPTVAKKEVIPVPGSEFVYKEPFLDQKTLVTFLSQSGETIDITEPLRRVQEKGIRTAALVNVFGSTLYREVDEKIWLETGPEICVVSTKAFTAKLAVFLLTAFALAGRRREGKRQLAAAIKETRRILTGAYLKKIDFLANKLYKRKHIYVIGRGVSFPIGLEVALKIKEVSYIHAEGLAAGELKHGPLALIEKGTPCIVLAPDDETYEESIASAMEIRSRGGYIIGVSPKNNEVFDFHLPVRNCGEASIIPNAVIGQLLGYYFGVKKKLDPDKPRNLAKSVTVK